MSKLIYHERFTNWENLNIGKMSGCQVLNIVAAHRG
ncbi:hypothetical protein BAZSYMB_SCAFFOLD00101_5 [Bathymodiolus azoricus thioautotrophic gill symbiont]|uniref:Uncharacterized protein n=1 Tax=Bathymodiolus azoricus thioautotrophic gill symbiont TaxID=235205 RepID=A0A1H6M0M2_9GAMM|nr:hypothetical protein BAZSYMB_SCAFFOLD00101_5 [Bathymodiolus azoricus thioautotrophic gill symbiont]